jgi:hypothetical protein
MKFDYILEPLDKKKPEGVSLFFAICSSRDIKPQCNSSLFNIAANTVARGHEFGLRRIDAVGGVAESLLSMARQRKLDIAMLGDYTHLVCFDDDMQFPSDTVVRLLSHNVDFVCANAAQKNPTKRNGVCLDHEGRRIDSSGKTGLEEIGWGSLAVSVLRLDAIRSISKPHFEVLWEPTLNNGKGGYQGEDHYFMKKMKAAGIRLYCDHDLSQEVFHVGDFPYGFGALPL